MSSGEAVAIQSVAGEVTNAVTVVLTDDSHRQRWCVTLPLEGKPRQGSCNGSSKETLGGASGVPAQVDVLALVGD
jgi:hypothetical protein